MAVESLTDVVEGALSQALGIVNFPVYSVWPMADAAQDDLDDSDVNMTIVVRAEVVLLRLEDTGWAG